MLLNLWLKKTISHSLCSFLSHFFPNFCSFKKEMTPLALQHPLSGIGTHRKQEKNVSSTYQLFICSSLISSFLNIIYDLSTFDTFTKDLKENEPLFVIPKQSKVFSFQSRQIELNFIIYIFFCSFSSIISVKSQVFFSSVVRRCKLVACYKITSRISRKTICCVAPINQMVYSYSMNEYFFPILILFPLCSYQLVGLCLPVFSLPPTDIPSRFSLTLDDCFQNRDGGSIVTRMIHEVLFVMLKICQATTKYL